MQSVLCSYCSSRIVDRYYTYVLRTGSGIRNYRYFESERIYITTSLLAVNLGYSKGQLESSSFPSGIFLKNTARSRRYFHRRTTIPTRHRQTAQTGRNNYFLRVTFLIPAGKRMLRNVRAANFGNWEPAWRSSRWRLLRKYFEASSRFRVRSRKRPAATTAAFVEAAVPQSVRTPLYRTVSHVLSSLLKGVSEQRIDGGSLLFVRQRFQLRFGTEFVHLSGSGSRQWKIIDSFQIWLDGKGRRNR